MRQSVYIISPLERRGLHVLFQTVLEPSCAEVVVIQVL